MAEPRDVLEAPSSGERVVFRKTAVQTGGELLELDLVSATTRL